jgi:hypothetical protein
MKPFAIATASMLVMLGCGSKQPPPARPPAVANESEATAPPAAAPADGSAIVIARTQTDGVIELTSDSDAAHVRADALMTEHCGHDNYQITQEGIEAIEPPGAVSRWRKHYVCFGPQGDTIVVP